MMDNGNGTDDIPRISEIEVQFNRNPNHDAAEFERQLKAQEEGLNSLTVDEFINNRDRYLKEGRSTEGNAAQQAAREKAYLDKIDELRKMDYLEKMQKIKLPNGSTIKLHYMNQIRLLVAIHFILPEREIKELIPLLAHNGKTR